MKRNRPSNVYLSALVAGLVASSALAAGTLVALAPALWWVVATLRREKGHDISAACGQLRLQQETAEGIVAVDR